MVSKAKQRSGNGRRPANRPITRDVPNCGPDELRETFRSAMRSGTTYEHEDVIHALASYLGFVRVTDTIHEPIGSTINNAFCERVLGYQESVIRRLN